MSIYRITSLLLWISPLKNLKSFYTQSACYLPWLVINLSCLSASSSLQTGRVLKQNEGQAGISINFFSEYEESIFDRRDGKDLGSNYNPYENAPHFGLSLFGGHGLGKGSEVNAITSLGTTAINGKTKIYSGTNYATSLGIGTTFPTLSWDYIETYIYHTSLYNSYDLLDNMTVYFNPVYFYDPGFYKDTLIAGFSTGLIFGKDDGLLFEWSLYETVNKKAKESIENFNIGLVTNLQGLSEKTSGIFSHNFSLKPIIGVESLPFLALGLRLNSSKSEIESWEIESLFGVSSLPERMRGTQEGYSSLHKYNVGKVIRFHENLFKIGLSRRELFTKALSPTGWHRISVKTNGFSITYRSMVKSLIIDWIGLYMPIEPFGSETMFLDTNNRSFEPNSKERRLARYYRFWPSLSLLKTTVEL